MFSKACEYGIRAATYIALRSLNDERVSLKDIAREIDSPEAFTAKILQSLAKNAIVRSLKGPTGGFEMRKPEIKQIKLSQIVDAIDGDAIYRGCALGLPACSEAFPCPAHDKFKKIRDDLKDMLETTSLYELTQGLQVGFTYLKR
jgi:Rrf2 family protein